MDFYLNKKYLINKYLTNKWLNISLIWFLFGAFLIYTIPPRYEDPLHYLSVAWEMYKNNFYLLTYSGGNLDLEKPPLFYWPIVAGWHVFGVNTLWPYIFLYVIGWFNLLLTAWLAKQLYQNIRLAWISVFILVTSIYWPIFCQDIRFESLVVFFGMLFLNFCIKAEISKRNFYWILAAIAFGLCTFSKGAVSFVFYLPFAACIPLFLNIADIRAWYLKLMAAVLCGLIIPILWILTLYLQQGWNPISYVLFGQVTNRVGVDFAKFYFPVQRIFENLLPWTCIYLIYLFKSKPPLEKKIVILWSIIFIQLLFFGFFVKMQRTHYVIPIFPISAILMSSLLVNHLSDKQLWWIGGLSLLGLAIYEIYLPTQYKSLQPIALQLKAIEKTGAPIVQFSHMPGHQNFEYLGKLEKDIPIMYDSKNQTTWLKVNPNGWIINAYQKLPVQCNLNYWWEIGNHWIVTLSTTKNYLDCTQK